MNNTIEVHRDSQIESIGLGADLFDRFIAYLDVSSISLETYKKAIKQLARYFSLNGIIKPTREDILNYREKLRATCKPATVQLYITTARLFFKWLEQEGLYRNIAEHIKGAKLSNKEHKKDYLTTEQIKTVFAGIDKESLQGLRDYAIIALMTTGGLRTIEVVRADIADIRTVGNSSVLYIQGKGKTEKTDYIKLSQPVERAIRAYLSARGNAEATEPLFASMSNNSKGSRLTTRAISGIVKDHLKSAGLNSDRLTAHSLRHTAVTIALLNGLSLQEVQQFARHSNISTTQIYAHNLDRLSNRSEQVITEAIF